MRQAISAIVCNCVSLSCTTCNIEYFLKDFPPNLVLFFYVKNTYNFAVYCQLWLVLSAKYCIIFMELCLTLLYYL